MPMSSYPTGFPNGVTLRNVPTVLPHTGQVFWVNNSVNVTPTAANAGSDGNAGGTYKRPFATLNYAISRCRAGAGDKIFIGAGHAETLSTPAAITFGTISGIEIIGMGSGNERPTFTFATSTAATITINAAGVTWRNCVFKCNINQLVSGIVISAPNCTLEDLEWQDTATNVEAAVGILTTAAADKLKIRGLRYMGQTGGSSCVSAVKLVGCDEGMIDIDFYGKASTAVVNFATTACTGIRVTGNFYVSGTTDGSKNIVDSQGSSTWWSDGFDGAAGVGFRGGSAKAISSASAAPRQTPPYLAAKVITSASASLTTGLSPVTLFTVTGDVEARVWATVQTGLTSTLNNGTLAIGVTGNTGAFLAAATMDGAQFPTGSVWVDTSPTVKAEAFAGTALSWAPIAGSANIICTIATNSATAGAITFYCEWYPVSPGSTVV